LLGVSAVFTGSGAKTVKAKAKGSNSLPFCESLIGTLPVG